MSQIEKNKSCEFSIGSTKKHRHRRKKHTKHMKGALKLDLEDVEKNKLREVFHEELMVWMESDNDKAQRIFINAIPAILPDTRDLEGNFINGQNFISRNSIVNIWKEYCSTDRFNEDKIFCCFNFMLQFVKVYGSTLEINKLIIETINN